MAMTQAEILALEVIIKGAKKARADLKATGDTAVKQNKRIRTSGKKTVDVFDQARISVARLRNVLLLAGFAGGLFAVGALAKKAEEIRSVSLAFKNLTSVAGESGDEMLNAMRDASKGFVDDTELMRQANSALTLGLPVTAQSMGELTAAAIKLGRSLGVDATRSIESVVTGIGRQSRLMLDNIGIIVNADLAYAKMARSLGTVASELTEAQRKLAFFNETVDSAKEKANRLSEDSLVLLSDRYITLGTKIKNTSDALVNFFNYIGSGQLEALLTLNELKMGFSEWMLSLEVFGKKVIDGKLREEMEMELDLMWGQSEMLVERIALERELQDERGKLVKAVDDAKEKSDAAEAALITTQNERAELARQAIVDQETQNKLMEEYIRLRVYDVELGLPPDPFAAPDPVADPDEPGGTNLFFDDSPDILEKFHSISASLLEARMIWHTNTLQIERELDKARLWEIYQRELNNAEDTKEAKQAIHEEYTQAIEAIDKKHDKKKKDAMKDSLRSSLENFSQIFDGSKSLRYALAVMDIAQGITRAYAEHMWPMSAIVAMQVATAGGAQITAISRQGRNTVGHAPTPSGGGAVPQSAVSDGPMISMRAPAEVRVYLEGSGYISISKEELAQELADAFSHQSQISGTAV